MTHQAALLQAVVDRIVPADADAGALAAGTDGFVLARLATSESDALLIEAGLTQLLERSGGFLDLAPEQQDEVLRAHETEAWFERLVTLTCEGFYADPDNGGNAGAVSWTMIGYRHGLPDGPSGPPQRENRDGR